VTDLISSSFSSSCEFYFVTSWQIDGEKVKTVTNFLFLGSKITEVDDCSHEIKTHLLLGRKAITD